MLSFLRGHESDLDYLLVSNLLTRKIRQQWEKRTNEFAAKGEKEPRQLVIVLEEAHKLLNREMEPRRPSAPSPRAAQILCDPPDC